MSIQARGTFENYCRQSVPEGIVLLETNGTLPLRKTDTVAVFGRAQFEYQKSGSGSGGLVCCPYVTNITDELEKRVKVDREIIDFYKRFIQENPFDKGNGWLYAKCQKQPILEDDLIAKTAKNNDKAIYLLCRVVGEGGDCEAKKGDWYLSEDEEQNIATLRKYFPNLIVLINTGNLMDMSWVKKYDIKTVAYIWQGGQEGGIGTVDALMGDVPPSGRLSDTIAKHIDSYPSTRCFGNEKKNVHEEDIFVGYRYFETFDKDAVLYPFGYGLNYTCFNQKLINAKKDGDTLSLQIKVQNVGNEKGKDVVQIYYEAPQGLLGNPKRQLIAFKKTALLQPNQEQVVELSVNVNDMASYDDSGKSGFPFAYVLEQGSYKIFYGQNVRETALALEFSLSETILVKQCVQALAPKEDFERMVLQNGKACKEFAPKAKYSLLERTKNARFKEIPYTGDKGILLKDVAEGKATLDEFISQADLDMLRHIVHGEGMCSPKAPIDGTASVMGGITKDWARLGVPIVTACDGPSGLRLTSAVPATCIPSASLIACAWAPEIFENVFSCLAKEMLKYHVDVLLAPGMNIHRNPLGGRNFEYFSEDPFITGACAKMIAKQLSEKGVFCTLKHFACNTQESGRRLEDQVISERAVREIYLKAFEMVVKSGYAQAIMSSYNRINGVSTCSNYDLITTILRDEWGYKGFVMTDWWPLIDDLDNNTAENQNVSSMIKAQNDIYMVVPSALSHEDDIKERLNDASLPTSALQLCVKNLLTFILKSHAFARGESGVWKGDDNLYFAKEVLLETTDFANGVQTNFADCDNYVIELEYLAVGDPLEQFDLRISVDGKEDIVLTVNKTDKKSKTVRHKAYLLTGSTIQIKSPEILALRILKY